MVHTITIETESDTDFALIKGLAQRLGLNTKESPMKTGNLSDEEARTLLERIAGSWEGDETGDELNEMIRSSRNDGPGKTAL